MPNPLICLISRMHEILSRSFAGSIVMAIAAADIVEGTMIAEAAVGKSFLIN